MNDILTISPEVEQGVKTLDSYTQSLVITTTEQAEEAGNNLAKISSLKKQIEDKRTEITKPLNASLKSINAFFKKFSEPLDNSDAQIRTVLVDFGKTVEQTTFGVVHLRSNQVISVVDENLVPREYLQVNMARVKIDVKSGKTIPGIEVLLDQTVSL